MSTAPNLIPISQLAKSSKRGSREILLTEASNEFVFAVVGHAGSGTSTVARTLAELLREAKFIGVSFDVEILKAREAHHRR